jgi:(2Fe-2S) ferredoxin
LELKDRVTIINTENMNGLYRLYGNMTDNDLERIINKHISVAIEEITEDLNVKQSATL